MDMERRWEMIVEVSPGAMARLMGFSSKKLRGLFHQQRWYFFVILFMKHGTQFGFSKMISIVILW